MQYTNCNFYCLVDKALVFKTMTVTIYKTYNLWRNSTFVPTATLKWLSRMNVKSMVSNSRFASAKPVSL